MITTTTHCVRCRAEIEDGSRFCDACGMPLGPANTSAGGPAGAGASDGTRLLAAATISKPQVRTWILKWMSERNRSTPPEIGVDLNLVARVAAFSEARSRRYDYLFAALGIVVLVTWGLQLVAVTAVVALCSAGLFLFKALTERGWLVGYFQRDQFDRPTIEERFTTRLTATQGAAVPPAGGNPG